MPYSPSFLVPIWLSPRGETLSYLREKECIPIHILFFLLGCRLLTRVSINSSFPPIRARRFSSRSYSSPFKTLRASALNNMDLIWHGRIHIHCRRHCAYTYLDKCWNAYASHQLECDFVLYAVFFTVLLMFPLHRIHYSCRR